MEGLVESAKQNAKASLDQLLKTFSFVPVDKQNWSPSPTAKSAQQILAHCAVSNGVFTAIINGDPFPPGPLEAVFANFEAEEKRLTTVDSAKEALIQSIQPVYAALDKLTPDRIGSIVETPVLNAPMPFFMNLPGIHMGNHAAQIDYLQTCWGDLDPHFG